MGDDNFSGRDKKKRRVGWDCVQQPPSALPAAAGPPIHPSNLRRHVRRHRRPALVQQRGALLLEAVDAAADHPQEDEELLLLVVLGGLIVALGWVGSVGVQGVGNPSHQAMKLPPPPPPAPPNRACIRPPNRPTCCSVSPSCSTAHSQCASSTAGPVAGGGPSDSRLDIKTLLKGEGPAAPSSTTAMRAQSSSISVQAAAMRARADAASGAARWRRLGLGD